MCDSQLVSDTISQINKMDVNIAHEDREVVDSVKLSNRTNSVTFTYDMLNAFSMHLIQNSQQAF